MTLKEAEKKHILDSIEQHRGNLTVVASELDCTIKTLYNKLHLWGIDHRQFWSESRRTRWKKYKGWKRKPPGQEMV